MTISIQRVAWAFILAMGMIAVLLADQSAPSSSPSTPADGEEAQPGAGKPAESSPTDQLDLLDPNAARSPTDAEASERTAEDAGPTLKPPHRTAVHRRALQLLRRGRLALASGNYDRAEQLVRLAEGTRVQFDESDSDTPGKLRSDLVKAQHPPVVEQSVEPPNDTPAKDIDPKLVNRASSAESPEAGERATETPQRTVQRVGDRSPKPAPPTNPAKVEGVKTVAYTESPHSEPRQTPEQVVTAGRPIREARQFPETDVSTAHVTEPQRTRPPEAPPTVSVPPQPATTGAVTLPPRIVLLRVPKRASQEAIAQKLLADARRAIARGDLDRGAALALRVKGLRVRLPHDGDTPDKVLRSVARLHRHQAFGRRETLPAADTSRDTTEPEVLPDSSPAMPVDYTIDLEKAGGTADSTTNGQVAESREAEAKVQKAAKPTPGSNRDEIQPSLIQAAEPPAYRAQPQPPIKVENLHFATAAQQPSIDEEMRNIPTPPLEPSAPGEVTPPTTEPTRPYPPEKSADRGQVEQQQAEPERTSPPARLPDGYFEPPGPQPSFNRKSAPGAVEPFVPTQQHPSHSVPLPDDSWYPAQVVTHERPCHQHQHCDGPVLPLWERILRCLCPKYRRIGIRPPSVEESMAGYYPTTWHRAPAFRENSLLPTVKELEKLDTGSSTDTATDESGPDTPKDAVPENPIPQQNGLDPNAEMLQ